MADAPDDDFDIDAEVETALAETSAGIFLGTDIISALPIILKHYATLTVYVIEPYIPQNNDEPLKIPAGTNYSIYDYGGRLVATPNDLWSAPFLASGELLAACEQMLQILLDASASEIAILGDTRAKLFVWDMCDRLQKAKLQELKVINFTATEDFKKIQKSVEEYLKGRGMQFRIRPGTPPKATPSA